MANTKYRVLIVVLSDSIGGRPPATAYFSSKLGVTSSLETATRVAQEELAEAQEAEHFLFTDVVTLAYESGKITGIVGKLSTYEGEENA